MEKTKNNWHNIEQLDDIPDNIRIQYISVWIITEDKKVVLISKNGLKWEFPGGKPKRGEEYVETLYRKVDEETGLDISLFDNRIIPFGYTLRNLDKDSEFVEVKYYLPLKEVKGWKLLMSSKRSLEDSTKGFCTAVELSEIASLLKDLKESGEMKAIKRLNTIE